MWLCLLERVTIRPAAFCNFVIVQADFEVSLTKLVILLSTHFSLSLSTSIIIPQPGLHYHYYMISIITIISPWQPSLLGVNSLLSSLSLHHHKHHHCSGPCLNHHSHPHHHHHHHQGPPSTLKIHGETVGDSPPWAPYIAHTVRLLTGAVSKD